MKKIKKPIYSRVRIILFIAGISILGLSFLWALVFNKYTVGSICMFFGSLLMIPASWKFYSNHRETEYSSIFWFVWFLTLPLLMIISLVYFYKILISP